MEILAKLLHPDAVAPRYANDGDAGCDLVAVESGDPSRGRRASPGRDGSRRGHSRRVTADSCCRAAVSPLATASRAPTRPASSTPGYRGEVKVALVNLDPESDYHVEKGDRIAQLVVLAVEAASFRWWTSYRARRVAKVALAASGR